MFIYWHIGNRYQCIENGSHGQQVQELLHGLHDSRAAIFNHSRCSWDHTTLKHRYANDLLNAVGEWRQRAFCTVNHWTSYINDQWIIIVTDHYSAGEAGDHPLTLPHASWIASQHQNHPHSSGNTLRQVNLDAAKNSALGRSCCSQRVSTVHALWFLLNQLSDSRRLQGFPANISGGGYIQCIPVMYTTLQNMHERFSTYCTVNIGNEPGIYL